MSLWSELKPKVSVFFANCPEVRPSLLHGDLWSGNASGSNFGPGEWHSTTQRMVQFSAFAA